MVDSKKATRSKKSSSLSKLASVPFLVHLLVLKRTWLFWKSQVDFFEKSNTEYLPNSLVLKLLSFEIGSSFSERVKNSLVLNLPTGMSKKGSYLWALGACVVKQWRMGHRRYKNEPLITHTHLMTWPPLTKRFLGPSSTLHTAHVHCYSKKPWSLIKAKVELSPFFWKHSPRGVVRVTYLRQFKSDFRFENWNMRVDKFLIDFS